MRRSGGQLRSDQYELAVSDQELADEMARGPAAIHGSQLSQSRSNVDHEMARRPAVSRRSQLLSDQ